MLSTQPKLVIGRKPLTALRDGLHLQGWRTAKEIKEVLDKLFNLAVDFDPVHQRAGMWYFWDETQSEALGPYKTEKKARESLASYVEQLNTESIEDDEGVAALFEAMEHHGNAEGTETQLGDAEEFLHMAIGYMPLDLRAKFMQDTEVQEFIRQEGMESNDSKSGDEA